MKKSTDTAVDIFLDVSEFSKVPRGTSALKSSVKLYLPTWGLLIILDLNCLQIFRTQNQLSSGVLQK